MGTSKSIIYDGTFNGFLTLIYQTFDNNWSISNIQKNTKASTELFSNTVYLKTDIALAKKVWFGINKRNHKAIKRIYYAFLSEQNQVEMVLFRYISYLMGKHLDGFELKTATENLDLLTAKVEKEKRRMEAFTQFQLTKERGETAHVSPRFNVLPLLSKHLRMSNKGREWQVFDDRRRYGIRYSTSGLELISNTTQVLAAV
ncbi:DUF4130 domain-containing protein [Muricauda sp. 2012CJ35-5]|uniref:DUF4130 domain-containing protein n=1 Tax=Flagellimonas spongiicola TaxID=2942208 RepID=A0ABT0PS14_9FLAO|nr:DUF4130 domain-containing protein [Allomuricauda spongiicola]MCL6273253.1 DUF4130 domain-containing protein [Allomuricauda spongiicola]